MFSFLSQKKNPKTNLVIVIESSHIRTAFVSCVPNHKPTIISSETISFSTENLKKVEEYVSVLDKTLSKVIAKLTKKHPTNIDAVQIVLSAPWYLARTHVYIRDEETPFSFTPKDSANILENEVLEFQKSLKNSYPNTHFELLEKNIVHIAVNGYPENSFPYKKIRKIEITSYVSFAHKNIITSISRCVSNFTQSAIVYSTSNSADFVVARDIFETLENFTLVSVGGDQTEISLISEGTLLSRATFPLGENLFKETVQKQNKHLASMISNLKMFQNKTLEEKKYQQFSQFLNLVSEDWRLGFTQSLSTLSQSGNISHTYIVICPKDAFVWIQQAIQDERNKHNIISSEKTRAILITTESLNSFITSKVSDIDTRLMIYTLFSSLKDNFHT